MDIKDLGNASAKIGDLLYLVAMQNARVVSDDTDQALSVIFNSTLFALTKSVAVAASSGKNMQPDEWNSFLAGIQKDLMAAAKETMVKRAGDGFKMLTFGH